MSWSAKRFNSLNQQGKKMLTFIEKLKVQQELSAKLATLKTNLGFIDKLTTQKAIAELLKKLSVDTKPPAEPENPLITELNQYLDVSAESILAKSLEDQAKYFESSRTRQREILLSLKESGDIKSNADSASIVMRKVIDHMIDIREKSLLSIEL